MTVTVYDKPNCTACEATKRWLDRRGIPYETKRLSPASPVMELAAANGWTSAPIVVAGASSWSGFRPDLIDKIKNI